MTDLYKYLNLKNDIATDLDTARKEVELATRAVQLAQAQKDAAVETFEALDAVNNFFVKLQKRAALSN